MGYSIEIIASFYLSTIDFHFSKDFSNCFARIETRLVEAEGTCWEIAALKRGQAISGWFKLNIAGSFLDSSQKATTNYFSNKFPSFQLMLSLFEVAQCFDYSQVFVVFIEKLDY